MRPVAWDHALSLLSLYVSHGRYFFPSRAKEAKKQKKKNSAWSQVMRPEDKATADSRSVQSFAIIENAGHGNFVIGRFHTRAINGLSVGDYPVYSPPFPTDRPFSDFF